MLMRHFRAALLAALLATTAAAPAFAAPVLKAPGGGKVFALIVGIDNYARLGPSAQLHGAAADARDIAAALTGAGLAVTPIIDAEATRARLIGELDKIVASAKQGDFVVIGFAGHGMQVPEYRQWAGIEPNGVNEQIALAGFSFSGEGAREVIVNKELRAYLARFDAKGVDVLVVMDSCFGGGMARGPDPRGGEIVQRSLPGSAGAGERERFIPIKMTEKEARTEIRSLAHVTFLAGATKDTVVPETLGLNRTDPKGARGALSYFLARALEGTLAQGGDVTLEQLFRYAGQNVRQVTDERQIIDIEPRSADAAVLSRVVLRLGTGAAPAQPLVPAASAGPALGDPIRLATLGASAPALSGPDKGRAPFVAATTAQDADLVWDAATHEALVHGDVILQGVDTSNLGGVIDRTWAIRDLQRQAVPRTLPLRMREEGRYYVPSETPELVAGAMRGRFLTVFNIAADGEVQMLFPTDGRNPQMSTDEWTYQPVVEKPFGADLVVAVTTQGPSDALLQWLNAHNHKRDAALVPAQIARAIAADASLRLGTVGLYTRASRS